MSAQHRATPEQWAEQQSWADADSESSCLIELRDRVLTQEACIKDIYDLLEQLRVGHSRNWARIVKLEEGPAVAEVRGPGSVATGCPQLATDQQIQDLYDGTHDTRINSLRAVYKLGLEHGAAIAKSQLADAEHV